MSPADEAFPVRNRDESDAPSLEAKTVSRRMSKFSVQNGNLVCRVAGGVVGLVHELQVPCQVMLLGHQGSMHTGSIAGRRRMAA